MLYEVKNGKARVYNPDNLPKNQRQREAVLAKLREVLDVPAKGHGKFFNLGTRARFVQG